jgi:BirA family biotin operon repressor/biotin-[acetyl-CoA-carboxylase] ligase
MTSNTEPSSANGGDGPVVPPWLGASTRFRRIDYVAETGSTNADLLARAGRVTSPSGDGGDKAEAEHSGREPQVLYTDHQNAGRGRQNRQWYDHPGDSLLVSVMVQVATEVASLVPLAVGLAALGAASDHLTHTDRKEPLLALKWPNDVLAPAFEQRKLAGILVESITVGGLSPTLAVVMGMGMNLRRTEPPPPDVARLAVTLSEMAGGTGNVPPPDRDRILDRYLVHLDHRLDQLPSRRSLLADYRFACITLGRRVRFQSGSEVISGMAVDIGSEGDLIVDTDGGDRRSLRAGDVHHLE